MKQTPRTPDWQGIVFEKCSVGSAPTAAETITATLLKRQGIPFTQDVRVEIHGVAPKKGSRKDGKFVYVPDFLFNGRAYLWQDDDGTVQVVHGIECKGWFEDTSDRHRRKRGRKPDLLREARGINLVVLSEERVKAYRDRGGFPMKPL